MARLCSASILLMTLCLLSGCVLTSGTRDGGVIDPDAMYRTDSTKQQRLALIGRWYRKQPTTDGGISEELTQINADGSYLFEFRFSHEGETSNRYSESGIWGVSGGYHFTVALAQGASEEKMVRVNPEDHKNSWVYKILELDQSNFRYQAVATGNVFELKRVAKDFRLP